MSRHPEHLDASELLDVADELEDHIANLQESGLFQLGAQDFGKSALVALRDARVAIRDGELENGAKLLSETRGYVHDAWFTRKPAFRMFGRFPFHLLVYHLLVLSIVLNVATGWGPLGRISAAFWGVPVQAIGFGVLGGVLRGMFWLQRKVSSGSYRKRFGLAHIAAPWVAGLFGLFAFLLLKAGLLTLEQGAAVDLDKSVGAYALVFLAGYSWEWILDWLDGLKARLRRPSYDPKTVALGKSLTDGEQANDAGSDSELSGPELLLRIPGQPPVMQQPQTGINLLATIPASPPKP